MEDKMSNAKEVAANVLLVEVSLKKIYHKILDSKMKVSFFMNF